MIQTLKHFFRRLLPKPLPVNPRISPDLMRFFCCYLEWALHGEPITNSFFSRGCKFSNRQGLCGNLYFYNKNLKDELDALLCQDFPDTFAYPFGGKERYKHESVRGTQHLNWRRIEWVKSYVYG